MADLQADCRDVLKLMEQRAHKPRTLIAIAGPPGSGKSTLAEAFVDQLNANKDTAALLPMDGFHLDNAFLEERGLLARKGAPETFDAQGFVDLVRAVRHPGVDIEYPVFDRTQDRAIHNAGLLKAATSIVVIEGNYLLLKVPVWKELKPLFDATVFLKPPLETLERRLIQRWLGFGYSAEMANQKANGNDIPNARLVLINSEPADLTLGD